MDNIKEIIENLESLYNNDVLRELLDRYNKIPKDKEVKEEPKINLLEYKMEVEKVIRGISKDKSYLVIRIINNNEKYNQFIGNIYHNIDIKKFIDKIKENRYNLLYLQEQYITGDKENIEMYINSIIEKFVDDFGMENYR